MTQRALVVLGLLLVSLAGLTLTGRSVFGSLSVLFAGVLIVAWAWSWAALRGLRLERTSRSLTSQVGRVFEETLSLNNDSRLPKLWVEVRDESDLPGSWAAARAIGLSTESGTHDFSGHRASAVAAGLGAGQAWLWTARTICTRRGRFRLGPTTLIGGDPFGLFPSHRSVGSVREVVVLPPTVPLPTFPIPAGRLSGGEALRRRTYQVTPNASGVREYAHGDSLSRIHWKSTARRGRLISKEFELDPMSDVWIVLDGQRRMHFGEPAGEESLAGKGPGRQLRLPPQTEEYMIAAAASVALHVLGRNRATGLLGYGTSRMVVQPERGEAQLFRLLEALAGFRPDRRFPDRDDLVLQGSDNRRAHTKRARRPLPRDARAPPTRARPGSLVRRTIRFRLTHVRTPSGAGLVGCGHPCARDPSRAAAGAVSQPAGRRFAP
ncbi:MAG: DUF58 protein [Anaerolineales bacterium]|nr:DUF58 protein [Anaerolineales bacterium]